MALTSKSHLDVEGYLTSKSRFILEDAFYDNLLSTGSNGDVLSKNASGQVVWAAPSGGGGSIDGTGVANKLAFFTDADTIDDTTLHWDSVNSRLGIGATSPSYSVDIQNELDMGGGTLHYDNAGKKIGINTISPSEKLDVNGTIRLRGALKDGGNGAGTSGQILTSTGTATDWVSPESVPFMQTFRFHSSLKTGTSGTKYMNWAGEGDASSLAYNVEFFTPYAGELVDVKARIDNTYSGITVALYDNTTSLWSSGSQTYVANTAKNFTPSSVTFAENDELNLRFTYPTATGNHFFQIYLTFLFNT